MGPFYPIMGPFTPMSSPRSERGAFVGGLRRLCKSVLEYSYSRLDLDVESDFRVVDSDLEIPSANPFQARFVDAIQQ